MKPHVRRAVRAYLALALFYFVNNLSLSTAQDDCLPDIGGGGDLKSVVLNIQTWEHRSSNFHVSMNYCNSILQLFTPSKIQEKPQFCLVKSGKTKRDIQQLKVPLCATDSRTSTDEDRGFNQISHIFTNFQVSVYADSNRQPKTAFGVLIGFLAKFYSY